MDKPGNNNEDALAPIKAMEEYHEKSYKSFWSREDNMSSRIMFESDLREFRKLYAKRA